MNSYCCCGCSYWIFGIEYLSCWWLCGGNGAFEWNEWGDKLPWLKLKSPFLNSSDCANDELKQLALSKEEQERNKENYNGVI